MGNGASRQPRSVPVLADQMTTESDTNQNITSLARLAEAKAKFLRTKGKKEALVKQVSVFLIMPASICNKAQFRGSFDIYFWE